MLDGDLELLHSQEGGTPQEEVMSLYSSGDALLRRLYKLLDARYGTHLPPAAISPDEFTLILRTLADGQQRLDRRLDDLSHKLDNIATTVHHEEILRPYDYPAIYREHYPQGARPIHEQIDWLATLFGITTPNARMAHEYAGHLLARPLPEGAEGLFAAVRPTYIGSTYQESVDRILYRQIIPTFYRFKRNLFSTKDMQNLGQEEFSRQRFEQAIEGQLSTIVVFPAQFGKLYANVSPSEVRSNAVEQTSRTFGLGLFTVCCMMLTHPERFAFGALGVNCPGDMCSMRHDKVGLLDHTPGISYDVWVGRELQMRCDRATIRYRNMGPATGFLFPEETPSAP